MFVQRDLFGGAIKVETAPDLIDASDIRQVPDTQEVFMFHFDSLAHDNAAREVEVKSVSEIPNTRRDDTSPAIVLKGIQHIPKFNKTTADIVHVFMALFRVESKSVDMVLTFNVPVVAGDGGAVGNEGLAKSERDFMTFVRSLHIVDYGLFA
ncbi:hypothetical protein B0H34DRAFT_672100 [Crassisporium funariophilum]|nr:hypothetical protein B0H34DRAFT_672100 [Crassisporium funariophilum]